MKNKIEDLRDHLFESIEMLKSGDMDVEKAKTISGVAQTIINSAKVEVDYLKATEQMKGSGFIPDDRGVTRRPPLKSIGEG